MLNETFRSRWFGGTLHAVLWVLLLGIVIISLTGRQLRFAEAAQQIETGTTLLPVARLEQLFPSTGTASARVTSTNPSLFATTHFLPAPKPAPTTRRIALTYHGYYRAGEGPELALIRAGDSFVNVPVGGMVVTNLYVAEATMQSLTLTNAAAETNLLKLNVRRDLEVPLP